jgi:hypothetical protein
MNSTIVCKGTESQEELFKKFKPMIWGEVWFCSKHYKIDSDELFAQASYIFCDCYTKYDSSRSSFFTWFFNNLCGAYGPHTGALADFCKKELRLRYRFVTTDCCDLFHESVFDCEFEKFIQTFESAE